MFYTLLCVNDAYNTIYLPWDCSEPKFVVKKKTKPVWMTKIVEEV